MRQQSQPPSDDDGTIAGRKDAHLELCLERDVGSSGPATGLGGFTFEYDALPELDLDDVALGCSLLGKPLKAPLVIGAMTGGSERAAEVNRRLARAAARVGVGMALGSQRAMIADPSATASYAVKEAAPDLPLLLGNVGAVQLNYGVGVAELRQAMSAVGADALNFHLNALQEAVQPGGDTRFAGLQAKLREATEALEFPCLAKEVGAGISARAAAKLAALPLAGVEVAGVGGTSWARVESYRAPAQSPQAWAGEQLAGFGIPTAASVVACRRAFGDRVVIASGGVRHGMDVAVALALGADAAALARPLLEAADVSEDAAVLRLEQIIYELRVICFCVGARDLAALRRTPLLAPGQPWSDRTETNP
jgi:isopentenyl-diphosphate delta-isomerase